MCSPRPAGGNVGRSRRGGAGKTAGLGGRSRAKLRNGSCERCGGRVCFVFAPSVVASEVCIDLKARFRSEFGGKQPGKVMDGHKFAAGVGCGVREIRGGEMPHAWSEEP